MENRFNDSIKRANCARILTPALALSLGLGLFASGDASVFGQQAQQAQQAQQSPQTQQAQQAQQTRVSETDKPAQYASPADLSRAFINVAKRVKPAVVHINMIGSVKRPASFNELGESAPFDLPLDLLADPQQAPRGTRGTGSGVIISPDGYILTNNHVAGAAEEIRVKLYDGRELRARRIGMDSETDLALIKVDAQNLPYATLGDSSKLEQGEWVIALGSPFGLEQTMTVGIVSATGRQFGGAYDNYIQTDASINPGNSGGPLLNMNGEVIGINTMIYSRSGGSEGIGFSIPSNMARKVQEQLARNGRVTRGFLGVSLQESQTAGGGAVIGDLSEGGPASKSGLRGGDVVVEFDGKPVKTSKQLSEIVADTPVGKAVKLKYVRDGQTQTTSITLAERPGRIVAGNQQAPAPRGQTPRGQQTPAPRGQQRQP
ncbi:MAG TPA: trypsin-like peptidase domain-containing protein [Blastocatellia bacterium]|nr:trypsin-like peptidase domain-containing protein [Blastocatellia bacterium]